MKYIIRPIHIAPTKPLNPSHVRHLMYVDALYKGLVAQGVDVLYSYNRMCMDVSTQALKLALYIGNRKNRTEKLSGALWVGKEYVKMTKRGTTISRTDLLKLRKQIEDGRQDHDYYDMILPEWRAQHNYLRLRDPGFDESAKFAISQTELVELLKKKGLVLDGRQDGENVYLDLTDQGIRLRKVCSADLFDYNSISTTLRDILSVAAQGDHVVLIFDDEMLENFLFIERVLQAFGMTVTKVLNNRVLLDGVAQASRHGGWESYTVAQMIERFKSQFTEEEVFLGLKMYFLGLFPSSFSYKKLESYMYKTRALLARLGSVKFDTDTAFPARYFYKRIFSPVFIAQSILSNRLPGVDQRILLDKLFY